MESIRLGPGMSVRTTREKSFLAYFRPSRGTMERRRFPTLDAAQKWLSQMHSRGPLPSLDAAQYADAQRAVSLLPPGVSMEDAARAYARSAPKTSPRLSEALAAFLSERAAFVRPDTLAGYRNVAGRFARSLPDDPRICEVAPGMVESFVRPMTGATRNSVLLSLSPLFSFAASRGWTSGNPVARVPRARKVEPPRGVLSPDEAARLLLAAARSAPQVVPRLAVGLFAGLRPAELDRLPASRIGPDYIRIDGTIAKTASARTVAIRPNLRAWLDAYPWRAIPHHAARYAAERARKAAGIASWPHDALRHSFATYAYEMSHDAAAVAAEMGHQGTAVFFKHYRALAEPGAGTAFFNIMPPSV